MERIKKWFKLSIVASLAFALVIACAYAEEPPSSPTGTETQAPPTQKAQEVFISFKNYPDHVFNPKEYIKGLEKGGHNLLIWKDPGVNLSQYTSVKLTEFGGRLLPEQTAFSYDTYIALFNSIFNTSLKLSQKESPDALLIEGALVECNLGSRTARYLVGFGAGKTAGAVVCELFEPGKASPCIRIYLRDTGSMGAFGGNSVAMLNHIFNVLAVRLAEKLNTTVSLNE